MRNTSTKRRSAGSTSANQNGNTAMRSIKAGGAERVFQPRVQRRQMLVRPMLDRGPQAQAVFDREPPSETYSIRSKTNA